MRSSLTHSAPQTSASTNPATTFDLLRFSRSSTTRLNRPSARGTVAQMRLPDGDITRLEYVGSLKMSATGSGAASAHVAVTASIEAATKALRAAAAHHPFIVGCLKSASRVLLATAILRRLRHGHESPTARWRDVRHTGWLCPEASMARPFTLVPHLIDLARGLPACGTDGTRPA